MLSRFSIVALNLLFLFSCTHKNETAPDMRYGLMNLKTWSLNMQGPVKLSGNWEMYAGVLLEPEQLSNVNFQRKAEFPPVPGDWPGISLKNRETVILTYRARVHLHPGDQKQRLALRVFSPGPAAYAVWINGQLRTLAADHPLRARHQYQELAATDRFLVITPTGNTLEIVIHLKKVFKTDNRLWANIYLGTEEQLRDERNLILALEFFVLGALIITILSHLVLFITRPHTSVYIWFALFCFFCALHLLVSGESPAILFWPEMPFELQFRLLLAILPGYMFLFAYFHDLFPDSFKKKSQVWLQRIGGALCVAIVIFPIDWYARIIIPCAIGAIAFMFYICIVMTRAIRSDDLQSQLFWLASIIILFASISDLLTSMMIVELPLVLPAGILVFISLQTYLLSVRSSRAFREVSSMSLELQKKNANLSSMNQEILTAQARLENFNRLLEKKVAQRTNEIHAKNQYLQTQTMQLKQGKEQIEQLNAHKTRLLSLLAHELEAPIGRIRMILDFLMKKNLSEKNITEYLILSRDSVSTVYGFLKNLLTWALSQKGDFKINLQSFILIDLVHEIINLLEMEAHSKQIKIHVHIPDDQKLRTDREFLSIVLRNLLHNAIKYTPQTGSIQIVSNKKDTWTEIQVIDDGIGFHPPRLVQLKAEKYSNSTVGTEGESGTGLGLALVCDLLEKSGGSLDIESQPGEGSKFLIRIPD